MVNCRFISNTAGTGGGLCADGPASIVDCIFVGNLVEHDEYGGWGGGLAVCGDGAATIVNCVIVNCLSMELGGAIYVGEDSSATFVNCTLSGNHTLEGSGIYAAKNSLSTAVNTIIAGGAGGGAASGTGDIQISYSNVFGNAGGDWIGPIAGQSGLKGNISEDPQFIAPESLDFHLNYDSPCRDTGDNTSVTRSEDQEGDPRIALGDVDIGADEFYYHLYHTGDTTPGGNINIKFVGYPSAQIELALGIQIIDPPFPTQHGDLYIWPLHWYGFVGTVPSDGILTIPVTIPSSWSSGDSVPMQALVGPWGGTFSRLTNLNVINVK